MFQHNVLITAYRRSHSLKRLLQTEFVQKAENLIISLDGPKESEEEHLQAKEMLQVIMGANLKMNVECISAEKNLGLYYAMRRGLDYAFGRHDFVTVLEEDCIPSLFALDYLEFLHRIGFDSDRHVCLSRHTRPKWLNKRDVTITKYPFVWGWHASSDVWQRSRGFVGNIEPREFSERMKSFRSWNEKIENFWLIMLKSCQEVEEARLSHSLDNLDTSVGLRKWALHSWATPYTLNYWMTGTSMGALRPPVNFIENIGFTDLATNTISRPIHARKLDFKFANCYRLAVSNDLEIDLEEDRRVFGVL